MCYLRAIRLILQMFYLLSFIAESSQQRRSEANRPLRSYKSPGNYPTGAASIPEMKAPVFRLSHIFNNINTDKLASYKSEEETDYEDEEEDEDYGGADEVQYYEDTTPAPHHEPPVIDAELYVASVNQEARLLRPRSTLKSF